MTQILYAALAGQASASDLYTVDPVTAIMTSVGPIGDPISGMAVDPTDGTIYGTTANNNPVNFGVLVTIDPVSGAETIVGSFSGDATFIHELAFDVTGQLYGTPGNTSLVTIDKTTGVCTSVGSPVARTEGGGLDFDSMGNLWCVGTFLSVGGGPPRIGTLDLTTGVFTTVSNTSDGNYYHSGKFDAFGVFWASGPGESGDASTDLVTIDLPSGVVTPVAPFSTPEVGALVWVTSGPPVLHANFTASPTGGYAPVTVAFTDLSTPGPSGPITAWFWTFGDGGNSILQNPTHVYTTPGAYTVQLTVTGTSPDGTATHTRTNYILVFGAKDTLIAALAGNQGTSDLYTVDPATAVMTSIGPIGYAVTGIAQDPTTGIVYGAVSANSLVDHGFLITIDINDGAGSPVGNIHSGVPAHDIAFDATGQLWGWDAQSGALWKINKHTGVTTAIGSAPNTYGGGLDFDSGGTLWKVGYHIDAIGTVNTSTGAVTFVVVTSDHNQWHSGKFDVFDVFWASGPGDTGAAGANLATIDQATGAVTVIAPFSVPGVGGLAWIAPPPVFPDFTVSLVPTSITIPHTVSTLVHLNTHALHGDTESITLSSSGSGFFTVTFPTNPITAGDINVVIDIAAASAPNGTYTIVIHCVGTDNSHDVNLTVNVVTAVPGFHIAE